MTFTDRYQHIREQIAYARRVETFGLSALLAPYTLSNRIPRQPSQDRVRPTTKALLPRR